MSSIKTPQSASFTGPTSPRYPAPDIARGLMLLLIAVANAPVWAYFLPETSANTAADQWWLLLRGMFIDHRIYPLFALLFGFGLMFMIQRSSTSHVRRRTEELDRNLPSLPEEIRANWIRGFQSEATDISRRLIRRRGWWMLLFGLLHGLFFFGDIIGTYALVAVIFAGVFARKQWKIMAWVSVGIIILSFVAFSFIQIFSETFAASGFSSDLTGNPSSMSWMLSPFYPLMSFFIWVNGVVGTIVLSMVVPSVFIGTKVAETSLLTEPAQHRKQLSIIAILGLSVGALGGLGHSLVQAQFLTTEPFFASAFLHEFSGIAGAVGWLAVLALIAGPAAEQLSGWQRALSAVGRRSMTAYIGQTLCFIVIFIVLGIVGVQSLTAIQVALIGVLVWVIVLIACLMMESTGRARGPLELLLRRAVARSAAPYPLPPIPSSPQVAESEQVSSEPINLLSPSEEHATQTRGETGAPQRGGSPRE